jgi:Ca-activated chloride channel family protein
MRFRFLSIIIIFSLWLSACGALGSVIPGASVTVSIVYGSEKRDWLEPLVQQFNEARNQTADGKTIVVEATAMGSIESVRGIIEGTLQPTVWSPASSVYIPVANSNGRNLTLMTWSQARRRT